MPENYVPFHIWNLWCDTGPPLGEGCHVIWKSEMMCPRTPFPNNGTDPAVVPQALSELMRGPQSTFVGRSAQRSVAKQEAADMMSPRPEDKRARDTRIKHLQLLLKSKFIAPHEKESYEKELFDALKASVCTPSFMSPRQSDSTATIDSRSQTPVVSGDAPGLKRFEACQFRTEYLGDIKKMQENLTSQFGICLADAPDASGLALTTFAHIAPFLPTHVPAVDSGSTFGICLADAPDASGPALTTFAHIAPISPTHVPAVDFSSAFADSCFAPLPLPAAATVAPKIKTPTSPVPPAASTSLAVLDLSKETFDSFLDRMRDSEKLYFAPAKPNGACFFEAFLLGMKSIAYFSPPYCQQPDGWKPKGIVPDWGTFDTQCMRKHVLAFMSDFIDMSFPLLARHGYGSFKDIILDEGKEHGVIDYARRDLGKGPQLFKTCAQYFKLMGEGGAYANMSCVLATCIAFNVCLKVYICKMDAPEVYGDDAGFVVSVCKYDRGGHYDTLMTDDKLEFLRHPPTGKDTYVFDIDSCGKHAGYGNETTCKVCKTVGMAGHTSHVTRHTSHVTRHTSHVTRHTSHVTRHTSHVTQRHHAQHTW